MKQTLLTLAWFFTLLLSAARADQPAPRPDRNAQPPSMIDPALDPCRYFTPDEDMVGFFIEMQQEERLVPMRVPKRYLEDRFDHEEGVKHGTQLFRIEVPTFEPVTRAETGRRNAAALPWDWMDFAVTDQLPMHHTVGLTLDLPITIEDIGKPRPIPDVNDFPSEPGPNGLTRVVAPERLGGEDLFVHYDDEQQLAGWMLCGVSGVNFTLNAGCSHTTRLSGMDVRMSFLRTELPNWHIIYQNVARFLTCATSEGL
ncbi:hypothetical protein [Yoonia vestfoldensis]|uniref:hypothetical protein n=1 Tax=Yoonia vestfoldensis TaxID=245188 RepID=UPI00037079CA|nr:hypothetical protein [Yoonia vestfoldensis]